MSDFNILPPCHPAAAAVTNADMLPFQIKEDKDLIVLVKSGEKYVMTLAECMCSVAKERGVTEVKLVDHALRPKMKAHMKYFFKTHTVAWNSE